MSTDSGLFLSIIEIFFHDFNGGLVEQLSIVHRPEEVEVGVSVLLHPCVGHLVVMLVVMMLMLM